MSAAYIVAAVRTAAGRKAGRLSDWHPADLAGKVLDELVSRAKADPALIDDVIMGCVSQFGQQSGNVAPQRRHGLVAARERFRATSGRPPVRLARSRHCSFAAAQAVMSRLRWTWSSPPVSKA